MQTKSVSRRRGKLLAPAAALIALSAEPADAGVMIDVRLTGYNGGTTYVQPKQLGIVPAAGHMLTFSIYARVSGTNGAHDDTIQSAAGNIISSGGVLGDLAAEPVATANGNFKGPGSQNGAVADLDGDGDLDVGTPMNSQNVTNFFNARSSVPVSPGININASTAEVLIGTAVFMVTFKGNADTLINWVNRVEANGAPTSEGAKWFQDGGFDGGGNVQNVNEFNPTNGTYAVGAPVVIPWFIPEPSGLTLAGLAGLGLLARRSRARIIGTSA